MASVRSTTISLHAPAIARSVDVGGPEDPARAARVEARIGDLLGTPPSAVLTSSCTAALEAAAAASGVGPGDEVIVPAFGFPTTAAAFANRGATLRFADVSPATGNITAEEVERTIGARTRAVVVLHYAGVGGPIAAVTELADRVDASVVEDAAHGLFGAVDGVPLGRLGRFGAISLHRTKNLSTLDGGILVVNRPEDIAATDMSVDKGTNRVEFEQGFADTYEWSGPGSAARMHPAAIALLDEQLGGADAVQRRRHHVWGRYATELAAWAAEHGVGLPQVPPGCAQPAHLFFLVLPPDVDRNRYTDRCADQGVEVVRHFGSLPASRYGRTIAHPDDTCPVAASFAGRLVRLPLHHLLDDADVDRVLEVVTGALQDRISTSFARTGDRSPTAWGGPGRSN
jgi:dTDP-4-amino-4,6-dideoxygalactose transaminase